MKHRPQMRLKLNSNGQREREREEQENIMDFCFFTLFLERNLNTWI
jgi:hypothetical protein